MIARTADRTLQIFEAYAERREPLTLSELARLLDMPVSSCSKLIRTLQARGYLYEVGRRKAWYPTHRWLAKASAIAAADPVADHVRPWLLRLRDQVGETVLLGKRLGDQVIYLTMAEGNQRIRAAGQVGDLRTLYSTASGKALLAQLPLAERLALLGRLLPAELAGPEPRRALLAEIEAGRQRGWWTTDPDNPEGVMSIAALLPLGGELCTLVLVGPISRVWSQREAHAAALLEICAAAAQAY